MAVRLCIRHHDNTSMAVSGYRGLTCRVIKNLTRILTEQHHLLCEAKSLIFYFKIANNDIIKVFLMGFWAIIKI